MGLNVVLNSNPGHATATDVAAIAAGQNTPKPGAPPGSSGNLRSMFASQLARGNPGGVDAASGIGIGVDAGA